MNSKQNFFFEIDYDKKEFDYNLNKNLIEFNQKRDEFRLII